MVSTRSQKWWQRSSAAGVLVALAACSSQSGTPDVFEDVDPGAVSGELEVRIADFEDGTTETQYLIHKESGEEQRLIFSGTPELKPGTRVHVWGSEAGEALRVDRYRVATRQDPALEGVGVQGSSLIGVPPQPARIVCPVLVEIGGGTGTITVDAIEQQFHVGPKSVNAYYIENSYGRNSVAGKTYGPLPYTATSTCDTSALSKALIPMVNDASCSQYSWVMVPKQSGCAWSGLASVGSPTKPAKDTWYNASIGCVVTVQEPGHNYGMNHSSGMYCSNGWFSDDLTTCTHDEYGDKLDPMGGGCRHMNVFQKQYQGWFGGCNAVKATASGTFNILPTESACNGLQALQLPFPAGKKRTFNRPAGGGGNAGTDTITSYYLEYRTSTGLFDTGLTPQVLVHIGGDPGGTGGGPHTWILDASAAPAVGKAVGANPGMKAGGTFSDPAGGLTVTVMSLDTEKAVVQVTYDTGSGSPTCMDGTTFAAPGDLTCAGPVSDGGTPPPPPEGGTGGSAGRGGAAGSSGAAGKGGTAGAAGSGGAAGTTGGVAGSGGAAGKGGTAGAAGSGGAGGTTGGAGGATGGVGGGDAGSGGSTTTGGRAGTGTQPPGNGCGCRIEDTSSSSGRFGAWSILALGTVLASRRRRRQ